MTGGFFAKFYVFSAAVKANLIWLTIIGVLNSGVVTYTTLNHRGDVHAPSAERGSG